VYEINAELAGVPRDQVKVELHGDLLTIRAWIQTTLRWIHALRRFLSLARRRI